jgi:hypothetical protein
MVFRQLNAMQMKQKETKFDKHFSVFYKKKPYCSSKLYQVKSIIGQ